MAETPNQAVKVQEPPSPEEQAFSLWRAQSETQRFFRFLADKRLKAMEDWANRRFVLATAGESEATNYEALGSVAVLADLLALTNQDIEEFYNDREQQFIRYQP